MAELVASSGGHDIDKWIERLYDCKPLSEAEVKSLCEQVCIFKAISCATLD